MRQQARARKASWSRRVGRCARAVGGGCGARRDEPAVLVVVVAAVGEQRMPSSARPDGAAAHRRDPVEQAEQLRDVLSVAGGRRPGEQQATAVDEEMVLAARASTIDRAGTRFRAPLFACRELESAAARDHSTRSAASSSRAGARADAPRRPRAPTPATAAKRSYRSPSQALVADAPS